jgi:hypothetical protein
VPWANHARLTRGRVLGQHTDVAGGALGGKDVLDHILVQQENEPSAVEDRGRFDIVVPGPDSAAPRGISVSTPFTDPQPFRESLGAPQACMTVPEESCYPAQKDGTVFAVSRLSH